MIKEKPEAFVLDVRLTFLNIVMICNNVTLFANEYIHSEDFTFVRHIVQHSLLKCNFTFVILTYYFFNK